MVDVFVDATAGSYLVEHDETAEFGPLLGHVMNMLNAPVPTPDVVLPGVGRYRFMFNALHSFRTVESTKSPGVQGADLLASTVARAARAALRDEAFDTELERLVLPALLFDRPRVAAMTASEAAQTALMRRLHDITQGG